MNLLIWGMFSFPSCHPHLGSFRCSVSLLPACAESSAALAGFPPAVTFLQTLPSLFLLGALSHASKLQEIHGQDVASRLPNDVLCFLGKKLTLRESDGGKLEA